MCLWESYKRKIHYKIEIENKREDKIEEKNKPKIERYKIKIPMPRAKNMDYEKKDERIPIACKLHLSRLNMSMFPVSSSTISLTCLWVLYLFLFVLFPFSIS